MFNAEAEKISNDWLAKYRDKIRKLPDDRQETYRQIASLSAQPQDIDLVRPKEWMAASAARERDGSEIKLPTYDHHALCDEHGLFPAELNPWEIEVLRAEIQRKGFKCWYATPIDRARTPWASPTKKTINSKSFGRTSCSLRKMTAQYRRGYRRSARDAPERRAAEAAGVGALRRSARRQLPANRSGCGKQRQDACAGLQARRCLRSHRTSSDCCGTFCWCTGWRLRISADAGSRSRGDHRCQFAPAPACSRCGTVKGFAGRPFPPQKDWAGAHRPCIRAATPSVGLVWWQATIDPYTAYSATAFLAMPSAGIVPLATIDSCCASIALSTAVCLIKFP